MSRVLSSCAWAAAIVCLGAAVATAVVDVSGPARGIAVVPFAVADEAAKGGSALPDVARLLAERLARLSTRRVVAPADLQFDERGLASPQARDVRRWATWNAVESVVVGRTRRDRRTGLDVAVELRSGHSGAPRAEYRLAPSQTGDLEGAVSRLAERILADLGEETTPASDALPDVAAPAPGVGSATSVLAASPEPKRADEGSLLPGADRDEPISINSEELEVLPQDGGRRLIFSRNVEVEQGDITLRADRLEAVYPQGASQPELLVARGHVRIEQGDRRGRCQEATYRRSSQTIVCRGKAEVLQGCDQVRGEEIVFDLARKRVRVTGAASVLIQAEGADGGCATATASAGEGGG